MKRPEYLELGARDFAFTLSNLAIVSNLIDLANRTKSDQELALIRKFFETRTLCPFVIGSQRRRYESTSSSAEEERKLVFSWTWSSLIEINQIKVSSFRLRSRSPVWLQSIWLEWNFTASQNDNECEWVWARMSTKVDLIVFKCGRSEKRIEITWQDWTTNKHEHIQHEYTKERKRNDLYE